MIFALYMVTTLSLETAMNPPGVICKYETALKKIKGKLYGSWNNSFNETPFTVKSEFDRTFYVFQTWYL